MSMGDLNHGMVGYQKANILKLADLNRLDAPHHAAPGTNDNDGCSINDESALDLQLPTGSTHARI